jgi:hypothetical protein
MLVFDEEVRTISTLCPQSVNYEHRQSGCLLHVLQERVLTALTEIQDPSPCHPRTLARYH